MRLGNFEVVAKPPLSRGVALLLLAMAALLALGVVFFYFEVDRIPVGR